MKFLVLALALLAPSAFAGTDYLACHGKGAYSIVDIFLSGIDALGTPPLEPTYCVVTLLGKPMSGFKAQHIDRGMVEVAPGFMNGFYSAAFKGDSIYIRIPEQSPKGPLTVYATLSLASKIIYAREV